MPYELLDHTGDIGIRVWAPSLEGIYAESARALFEIMVEGPPVAPAGTETFGVQAEEPAEGLRDFLSELLYRFAVERKIYGSFEPGSDGVRAEWELFAADRHGIRTELKAVTYHQLEAKQEKDGWSAQVIFDV